MILRGTTTDATQTELFIDDGADRIVISSDTTWAFEIDVTARRTDTDSDSAGFRIKGVVDNNAGTTSLVGFITVEVWAKDSAAWGVTAEADDTNDAIIVKVTGEAAKNILWIGTVKLNGATG